MVSLWSPLKQISWAIALTGNPLTVAYFVRGHGPNTPSLGVGDGHEHSSSSANSDQDSLYGSPDHDPALAEPKRIQGHKTGLFHDPLGAGRRGTVQQFPVAVIPVSCFALPPPGEKIIPGESRPVSPVLPLPFSRRIFTQPAKRRSEERMSLRDAYHFLRHRRSIADPRKARTRFPRVVSRGFAPMARGPKPNPRDNLRERQVEGQTEAG